jgi:hypothetical protein
VYIIISVPIEIEVIGNMLIKQRTAEAKLVKIIIEELIHDITFGGFRRKALVLIL